MYLMYDYIQIKLKLKKIRTPKVKDFINKKRVYTVLPTRQFLIIKK